MDYIFLGLGEEIIYAGWKNWLPSYAKSQWECGGVYFKEKKMKIKI